MNPLTAAEVAARRERVLIVVTALLLLAACLPLTRVFLGVGFLAPVYAAALLALGVDWGARRLGAGPGLTLLATVAAWALYTGLVFAPDTLLLAVLPTPATVGAVRDLWLDGLTLVRTSPSPTYAEPALLLLCVTGVWAVAHAVDGLVMRLGAPISAIVLTLVLWTVPLALAPQISTAWLWALPLLAAAAALLLASASADVGRYGRWVRPGDPGGLRAAGNPITAGGTLLAVSAIVVGSLVAGVLPGFGERPWYELRGSGGTSLTTNPIVGMHTRLVSDDIGPVLKVRSPRPLYLRTTSLDVYDSDREIWTITGGTVSGGEAQGTVFLSDEIGQAEQVPVSTEVVNLAGGKIVPLPYQATSVIDTSGDPLRYDPVHAAFFLSGEDTMQPGDRFEVLASVPNPTADQLSVAGGAVVDPSLTALPEMPPEVEQLAREIVERAGATTWLEQAIAIQNELRTWTYSLEVVPTHRRAAVVAFLEERRGYCEQFAATMAVMLRGLGVPARVAVGFTPGVPDRPDLVGSGQAVTYTVSLANSHAWVEVLFPGYGWIAFEPTPRSDGNVLVPTASNLAPAQTVIPPQATPEFAPGADDLREEQDLLRGGDPLDGGAAAETATAGGADRSPLPLLVTLGTVVAVAGAGLWLVSRRASASAPPPERVLRARQRIRRLGAGLGAPPAVAETDAEYLRRLLGFLPVTAGAGGERRLSARRAADDLGLRVEQAQWAPELPEGAAEEAEEAAAELESLLLDHRPAGQRLRIRARAALLGMTGRVPRRARQRERELVA